MLVIAQNNIMQSYKLIVLMCKFMADAGTLTPFYGIVKRTRKGPFLFVETNPATYTIVVLD